MKKYGGVNNSKTLNEIQEAYVISESIKPILTKKKSIAATIIKWLVYLIVSYIIIYFLIIIISDGKALSKMPFWALIICPAIPFVITFIYSCIKKRTVRKD